MKKQLDEMAYCPSFQITHDKALEWGEAVAGHGSLRERGLSKVFFTMCGSTSVDTALKMALAYQRARGQVWADFSSFLELECAGIIFCCCLGFPVRCRREVPAALT